MANQLSLFDKPPIMNREQLLHDLFRAYFDARKNKRNTINQLRFEQNYEGKLLQLYNNICDYNYHPLRSICFIINKPVKREIFAADFTDRVVHHLIYNYIYPIFDKTFINDSYSCRKGKGTHYGIKRIDHFIRSCSHNYTKDCYILKLDIQGYFMSINKHLLYSQVNTVLKKNMHNTAFDFALTQYLIKQTVFNNPVDNCIVKGSKKDWCGLPSNKILFYASQGSGLPIGNLTSQLFGNVYLNAFDHYVKKDLGIKYYGRYVDDFILIHPNKAYLKSLIPEIKNYLNSKLGLTLHPKKVYLQHYTKGVKYLGAVIKPYYTSIDKRTKANFYNAIQKQNKIAEKGSSHENAQSYIACMNSYLGIAKHYKSYRCIKRLIFNNLSSQCWQYAWLQGDLSKFGLKHAKL